MNLTVILAIISGSLIGFSHWFEAIGFYMRVVGANHGLPALGYSAHVQIATISRFGTLLAFPLIGYLIDSGHSAIIILYSFVSYAFTFVLLNAATAKSDLESAFYEKIFFFIMNNVNSIGAIKPNKSPPDYSNNFEYNKLKLLLLSLFSYGIIIFGVFSVFFVSTIVPEYRATVLQVGPLITGVGAVVSSTYFDPYVSLIMDRSAKKSDAIYLIIKGRSLSAMLLAIIMSSVSFYYV